MRQFLDCAGTVEARLETIVPLSTLSEYIPWRKGLIKRQALRGGRIHQTHENGGI